MNCEEATLCIRPFIDGTITKEQLEGFLEHVKDCRDCYEELDIMYMVHEGLAGLESDTKDSFDFTGMLSSRIDAGWRYLRRIRLRNRVLRLMQLLAYAALVIATVRIFGYL